jgi:pyruvate carboxylase
MCGIPLTPGTPCAATLDEVREFFETDGQRKIMIKAVSGGGGRGMRAVFEAEKLKEAYTLCADEALAAFGNRDVYAERLIPKARHVEIQIIGDGTGAVTHLHERECTIQRRNQKIIEVAPGPDLPSVIRDNLIRAAVHLASEIRYSGIGSFEFLVDMDEKDAENAFFFLEVNPRVQVEHTVTEEVTGVDLVKTQIALAAGRTLEQLGLLQADIPKPQGYAVELRINMEIMGKNGGVRPSSGTITEFAPPMGPGIRVDTFAYPGYTVNPNFDSLLAKLVVHSRTANYADALNKAYLALCEFRIEGVETNIPILLNLLRHQDVIAHNVSTVFMAENMEIGRASCRERVS